MVNMNPLSAWWNLDSDYCQIVQRLVNIRPSPGTFNILPLLSPYTGPTPTVRTLGSVVASSTYKGP